MAEDKVTFELKEPASPEALLPHDYTLAGVLGAAVLALGLGLGLLLRWRRRRRASQRPQAIRALAYKDAAGSLERISAAHGRAAAVQASLILRKYLALAAADPALYETHEEFIARHDALHSLTEPAQAACATGFARLAALKYAPADAVQDAAAVVAAARVLLETLHHGFRD
jgi:hypothetical protein